MGLLLVLTGHGDAKKVLLRLSDLPFVQLFQRRETGAPFLDSSNMFRKDLTEATIAKRLAVAFFEAKGDASSTVQVLLGYYKCKSQLTGKSQPADAKTYNEPDYSTIIREELDESTISALSPWLTKSTKRLWF